MFEYSRLLCRHVADVLGLDGAAISLASDSDHSWDVVAASSSSAQSFDDAQFCVAQGPVVDVLRGGVMRLVDDLAVESARWPLLFGHTPAWHVGCCGVMPVSFGGRFQGALTMHRTSAGIRYNNLGKAAHLTGLAGVALTWDLSLLEQRAAGEPPMFGRASVAIASGMVAARLAISPLDAMAVLRAYSFQLDVSIFAVATAIANRTLDASAIIDN